MNVASRVLIVAVSVAGLLAGWAQPAFASCAEPPVASPAAFTGTVLSTESDGRIAQVRTDDADMVEVRGTPSTDGAVTSVDRTYLVGTRYEFHPLNTTSPYEDNACTATHVIEPASPTAAPPSLTAGESADASSNAGWLVGGGVLAVVLAAGALVTVRRSRAR